jgi:hypothetical protein
MTTKPNKAQIETAKRDREPSARRRPELDLPDTEPMPSGVRPDLDEAGDDGQGGDAGGVGNSI